MLLNFDGDGDGTCKQALYACTHGKKSRKFPIAIPMCSIDTRLQGLKSQPPSGIMCCEPPLTPCSLYLVDGVSDGEEIDALLPQAAPVLLQTRDEHRPELFRRVIVRINHLHAVLRVRPKRICGKHGRLHEYIESMGKMLQYSHFNTLIFIIF